VKVEWSSHALFDLKSSKEYIAKNNKPASVKVIKRIKRKSLTLSTYPLSGRVGRVDGTMELVVNKTPYIIIYEVKGNDVHVLRVVHHSQQWPARHKQ